MSDKKLLDPNRIRVLKRISEESHGGYISSNASSQALVAKMDQYNEIAHRNSSEESIDYAQPVHQNPVKSPNFVSKADWATLAVLTFVNLINYMDRYTIAGVLGSVQEYYGISNGHAGLLQTAFVASFMIFAPLFGFLGDRYDRKWVMIFGITIWAAATLWGSFMTGYKGFMVMRALVGIGEASYTTIAPTIISDLFVKEMRSKALAIFYFAIPVGSGLGYVAGKALADLFGEWQWALRGTPILGIVAVVTIFLFVKDPPRGESEGHDQLKATSYSEDLKDLGTNKSFIFSTLGFTCVTFCTGALSWWGPKFLQDSIKASNIATADRPMNPQSIAFAFGVITMLSGILGVPMGSLMSTKWRPKNQRADALICGFGLALSSVFLCLALFTCNANFFLAFALIFLGEISLNLNWSIVADILLYVVVPTRRGSAEAIQILISHLFGDAGSPYLIGIVSDSLKQSSVSADAYCPAIGPEELKADNATALCEHTRDFYSMQYSLVVNILIVFLGALCFFVCAIWIVEDKERVEQLVAATSEKEEMMSEYNSAWSQDDLPPEIVIANVQNESATKAEPLLEPLGFRPISNSTLACIVPSG